jgi:pSer/pThr/pTyr-binding forkhead associated (FHA) protein
MLVHLVVEKGGKRTRVQLKPPVAVVGRSHGNAVRIPSAQVSRQHCRFRLERGLVYLDDLGSINGTFLNGLRVKGTQVVRPGDQIDIGPVRFTAEYELTPQALDQLRAEEEPIDAELLDALADGEAEAVEVVEEDELALAIDDAVTDDKGTLKDDNLPLLEIADDEPTLAPQQDPARPEFTFNQPWQMPESDDLRDILSQMEDDSSSPRKKPRK